MSSRTHPSSLPIQRQFPPQLVICSWKPDQQNRKPAIRLNHSRQDIQVAPVSGHSKFSHSDLPNLDPQSFGKLLPVSPLGCMCDLSIRVGGCRSQRMTDVQCLPRSLSILFLFLLLLFFQIRSHCVALAGLEFRDLPASPF